MGHCKWNFVMISQMIVRCKIFFGIHFCQVFASVVTLSYQTAVITACVFLTRLMLLLPLIFFAFYCIFPHSSPHFSHTYSSEKGRFFWLWVSGWSMVFNSSTSKGFFIFLSLCLPLSIRRCFPLYYNSSFASLCSAYLWYFQSIAWKLYNGFQI